MKRPQKNRRYDCPHGKNFEEYNYNDKKVIACVPASYCKNNCDKYKKTCEKWN